jgi:Domain of unknown function (DUF4277)
MQVAILESVTKTIGSLALAYPYLRRLRVAESIAEVVTKGWERDVPTGQVIEVLVLNRLSLRPSAISKVGLWATSQAVEEVYGLEGEALNDDRIGRALDEIHPHLSDLWAAIVLRGAQAYGVSLRQLHSDVTRLAFEGDYAEVPTKTVTKTVEGKALARITYGYTGREDPTRKQLTVSLSVSADGGLPTWYRVSDGNAPDVRAYPVHLQALREHLGLDKPLMIGDSKLVTKANLLGFCRVEARFVGPTSLGETDRETLLSLWEAGRPWERLDPPEADSKPTAGRYWGIEFAEILQDPERKTAYRLRRLFVQSIADRKAARHQRAKDLAKAHQALWTIKHRLDRPVYRDRGLVERKAQEAIAKVGRYLQVEVIALGEGPSEGCDLRWTLDCNQLRVDELFDGVYCLLTNLPDAEASSQAVFRAYKGQSKVEGRFRAIKQPPIEVRPIWLHQPRRIESLIFVVMVALYLFALIEREARRVVKASGQVFKGLRPEGRDKLPVTAERLFEVFASLSLVLQRLRIGAEIVETFTPATLSPIQAQILDRLGLPRPNLYIQPMIQLSIAPHPS